MGEKLGLAAYILLGVPSSWRWGPLCKCRAQSNLPFTNTAGPPRSQERMPSSTQRILFVNAKASSQMRWLVNLAFADAAKVIMIVVANFPWPSWMWRLFLRCTSWCCTNYTWYLSSFWVDLQDSFRIMWMQMSYATLPKSIFSQLCHQNFQLSSFQ